MARSAVWGIGLVVVVMFAGMLAGISGTAVHSAERELPSFTVGDTYAFVGLQGGVVSGVVVGTGPYPWVEVKVDNVDANVYQINLEHVERFKHMK